MNKLIILTKDKPPKEQIKTLTNSVPRQEIVRFAKDIGITWKLTDNPNINWMRCSMAIQNQFELFCNSWNQYTNSQYTTEISKELAISTEDKSPEKLYISGDFQPHELLTHPLKSEFYVGSKFNFLEENIEIEGILNEKGHDEYLFSYENKIVSMNKLELNNIFLIESFIKRGFKKTFICSEIKHGNPIKFWNRNQYTLQQILEKYYLDTTLTYKNSKYSFKFLRTREGWRYLSLRGRLYWFTSEELAYIVSNLKLIQKQFP